MHMYFEIQSISTFIKKKNCAFSQGDVNVVIDKGKIP